jgi:hypothetical protein
VRLPIELARITTIEAVYFKPGGGCPTNIAAGPGTINLFAMDCLSQFTMGLYYVVQDIHHRRDPLVDTERGVVWAHRVFDQGTVGRVASSSPRRFTENGKIRRVEMIGPSATYHINSPWGGLSGN